MACYSNKHKQQGVAILTVLLMVALATITVVSMSTRQRLDIRRAVNQTALQQARALALGGEKFAAANLMRDKKDPLTAKTDNLDEDWAQSLPPLPVDQSTIKGCVFDMQGRFNLNNLVTAEGKVIQAQFDQLQRLLSALNISSAKASAIVDWIDTDSEPTGEDGAEESYYSGLEPPYRPANRQVASISELKMVKGFSPAVEDDRADYELLLPHISALPELTKININTATPAVIASLDVELTEKAEKLSRWGDSEWENYPECADPFDLSDLADKVNDAASDEEPLENKEAFDDITAFVTSAGITADSDAAESINDQISVDSNYFQIRVDIETGEVALSQYSLVRRDKTGANAVLQRSRNVF